MSNDKTLPLKSSYGRNVRTARVAHVRSHTEKACHEMARLVQLASTGGHPDFKPGCVPEVLVAPRGTSHTICGAKSENFCERREYSTSYIKESKTGSHLMAWRTVQA